jgi:hypothetical protein
MKTRQRIFSILSTLALCITAGTAPAADSTFEDKLEAANAGVTPYVAGVVRLAASGIDAAVLQSYVENAVNVAPLKADEVIFLHNKAVPGPVIAAMIRRGATVQEVPVPAPAPAIVINTAPPAPAPVYVQPQPTTVYVAPPQTTYTYLPSPTYVYQPSPNVIFPRAPTMTYRSLGFHYGGGLDYCYSSYYPSYSYRSYPSHSHHSSYSHRRR